MRLEGKVAILTGASSGIGKATAIRFAEEGAKVVAMARRVEKLDELKEETKDLSGEVYPYPGDVAKDEDIKKVVAAAIIKYGKIDILINNAGVLDGFLSADNMEDDVWDRVMAVNLTGPMKMTREVIPHMKKAESGNIINISSVGGLFGGKGGLGYVTSKHGIIGMTKHVGVMFSEYGIRCNAIAPGTIKTDIGQGVENPNMHVLNKVMKSAEVFETAGESKDIANVMLFLASDESKFINGETVVADGGWTAI